MSFNFPSSPTNGQVFIPVAGGPSYAWDGTAWVLTSSGISGGVYIGDTAPLNPVPGQLWWESDSGNTFIYFSDGSSSQWVQFNASPVPTGDNASTAADMSIGFRTSGNRFVVNDKADLSGSDVMTVAESGSTSFVGNLTSAGNFSSSGANVYLNTASAGTVHLRPNGTGVTTGQTTIDSAGNMTVANTVNCARVTGAGAISINTTGASFIYLRPNGEGLATGQTSIDSAGAMTVAGGVSWAAFSATGATTGGQLTNVGVINTSRNVATIASQHIFYNPNGAVGQISTTNSATAYNTSSDERLKNVGADYDPAEAIAIIRADPVKNFQWKAGNIDAVGWIAQRSYAVHEDLATRVVSSVAGDKGEAVEEEFWGIDYGKRTPYLWAALSAALDKIDALEARIAALEGE